MDDFEKLGAFYLGKAFDLERRALKDELVLYDSKDLTTHAAIIGMTGSGKTGLGIGLLEEAAIDRVPVIAIDPKGDLANMLLTFPELRPQDFEPWISPQEASNAGRTVAEHARAQAELWRKGLAQWDQGPERVRRLREAADFAVYTPGSAAGQPVSILSSFAAPQASLRADRDLYNERIQATATGLLTLLEIDADPITSREHILLCNLMLHFWDGGTDLDLAGLIAAIQSPPVERIGVMDLDSFFPARDRFELAMRLNNLLAAPGFGAWLEGVPLDARSLLYTDTGKPRVAVMSIAHLPDSQRMFFVTMLLNEVLGWIRTQPGTGSLRAILYMDEVFGYLPPVANPPSKPLFLTLLKQARAYGLGLVLATQNPVDLDYKALSNTGTWLIGRLQTERDKARLMEGLQGADIGGRLDSKALERTLSALGKRVFLLHNVHESEPVVFHTRWAMSYLAGPLTREQIKQLSQAHAPAVPKEEPAHPSERAAGKALSRPPVLPPAIPQHYLPARQTDGSLVYHPFLIGVANVAHSSARYKVQSECQLAMLTEIRDGPVAVDWNEAEALALDVEALESTPRNGARFEELPAGASSVKSFQSWEKLFKRWIRTEQKLTLYRSPKFKEISRPEEAEGDFRVRLQELGHEERDRLAEKLRKKYAPKIRTLEERLQRAQQKLEVEAEQSKQGKLDTAVAFGTALLGAFLGRKTVSSTSASRVGTAVRTAGRARKQASDVDRARETIATVKDRLEALQAEFEQELEQLETRYDAQAEELDEISITPKSTDIHVHFTGIAWAPFVRGADNRLAPAWR